MRFDGTFPSFRLGITTYEDLLLVLERLMCLLPLNLILLHTCIQVVF